MKGMVVVDAGLHLFGGDQALRFGLMTDEKALGAALNEPLHLPIGDAGLPVQRLGNDVQRVCWKHYPSLAFRRRWGPPEEIGTHSLCPLPHQPPSRAKSLPIPVMLCSRSGT